MEYGQPQASTGGSVVRAILSLLPDWVEWTVLSLIAAWLVSLGAVQVWRRIQYCRAVRAGRPIHAAAQYGQGRGADCLGSYAPPRRPDADGD
ncbi:hypothetical protein ACQEVG_12550 [Streptomyces sp. CA-135486]|uniref:hypothetical protein n=1 Tax=Streptomyces sp. CA-135486 TaxID=3240049 RepID=UPI003D92CEBA